jgi:DNA-binding HxlR family transcriptional regulator
MKWAALLADVMAVLRDGHTAEALAAHEASLRVLLHNMATTGHAREGPVRSSLARAGDRWSTLILECLAGGPMRHTELRRVIDLISAEQEISQRVLTLKLRSLERDGLVSRALTPGAPPRVDYALTPRGHEWHVLVETVVAWAGRHTEAILQSRRVYDVQHGSPDDDRGL